jgi:replicative DNA helicase
MSELLENTFTAYLGPDFQQKLMWQLLVEPEFAEKTIPNLSVEYFDDPYLKRLFIIILEYYNDNQKVPNLQNKSIHTAINKYKTPNNKIEEESLFSAISRIELWNERIINKQMLHDGDAVQRETSDFVKQQEWRKFAEFILDKTKNGEIRKKYILGEIDEKILKISHIGDEEDYGTEVGENIEKVLRKEFRKTIPTGINVIDALTGGGLGKGEIGLILTPSGVGKTTMLTKIANTAYEDEYNVLQIIFEDTTEQIQRKHYTIWTNNVFLQKNPNAKPEDMMALSKIDDNSEEVLKIARAKTDAMKGKAHLVIKRLSQENTTMLDIRNWIIRYQKKWGYKFDLVVIDYLDCLESHKKSPDRNEAELAIIKSFEAMAADFDIPAWSALQSNRSGFGAEFVEAHQTGGNIKRLQKAHFFMSVAKTQDQQEANLANIRIIKARFAKDGQTFTDCIFNNDTMQIIIEDSRYTNTKVYRGLKKYDTEDIDKLDKHAEIIQDNKPPTNIIIHSHISQFEEKAIEKVNNDGVSDAVNDGVKKITEYSPNEINDLLKQNGKNIAETNTEITNQHVNDIIEIEGAVEGAIEGAIEEIKTGIVEETVDEIEDIIGWTGESFNVNVVENEVKLEDVQPEKIPQIEEKKTEITLPNENFNQKNANKIELEKYLLIDPDAPTGEHLDVIEMLKKREKEQGVIKKE